MKKSHKLTDQDKIDVVKHYNNGLSLSQIGKIYKIHASSVRLLLINRNIKLRPGGLPCQRGRFKDDAFDIIDNEEKAYWLGFIMGDGCITIRSVSIELASKDKEHLNKFKNFLNLKHEIKNTKKGVKISVHSKYLKDVCVNYGIIQRKSKQNNLIPNNIPKEFIKDFYRGILDADGSITNGNMIKKHFKFIFTSKDYNFLLEIKDWINNEINQKCGSFWQSTSGYTNKKNTWILTFSGKYIFIKLYNLFYKNSTIYLDRKYKKATEFYNILNN